MADLSPGFLDSLCLAPNPLYVTDEQNHIIAWNRTAEQLPVEEVAEPASRGVLHGTGESVHHLGVQTMLTPREQQVLRLLAAGANTNEIGDALFIAHATVRTHVRNVLKKLNAHSRLEAVSSARRQHLLD